MADEDTAQAPTGPTAPVEPATAPEAAPSEPVEGPPAETQTAQIPVSEPLPPEPEPIAPTPASEPPQAASAPAASAPVVTHPARDLLVKARATIQDRKRKKLDKIMEALNAKAKSGSTSSPQVTNDEVEKLLHVSDATATRYLSALEKEGKIQQVGKTGKAVAYTRI
ncbi:MAG: polymerase III, subunit gamma and tau protein [Candidatus Magasanikbacteria bacterium GW2011_GWA2_42_32]|uniref:Polymerase III, subunit gamma and tau protein n=1 Tax=Candidatus Magasanikbacteria bacterium GW2011_GWA2_42_32 TaxID=1619039 RepID=A0A0G1D151_9BACT|nr:MAG: polymerase III, subunit gamma and tau protein [Candidatus Magasanikbacteria bacterium GW2011_GWA2_42_32]